jgi:hypothetical protein
VPLILVQTYRRFVGTCCSILHSYDKGKASFRNVGKFLLHYTTLHYTESYPSIEIICVSINSNTHPKKYTLIISQLLWNFPRKITPCKKNYLLYMQSDTTARIFRIYPIFIDLFLLKITLFKTLYYQVPHDHSATPCVATKLCDFQ